MLMMTRKLVLSGMTALALAASACDAQNDGAYQGEPLATIRGTIVNELPGIPPDAELAVVWDVPAYSPTTGKLEGLAGRVAEKATVTPTFPSNFQFDIHLPPPPDAVFERYVQGNPAAYGQLIVFKAGTVTTGSLDAQAYMDAAIAQADEGILYLPTAPSAYAAAIMGGASTPGFHLLGTKTYGAAEAQQVLAACRAVAPSEAEAKTCGEDGQTEFVHAETDGFAHPITIVLKAPPTKPN